MTTPHRNMLMSKLLMAGQYDRETPSPVDLSRYDGDVVARSELFPVGEYRQPNGLLQYGLAWPGILSGELPNAGDRSPEAAEAYGRATVSTAMLPGAAAKSARAAAPAQNAIRAFHGGRGNSFDGRSTLWSAPGESGANFASAWAGNNGAVYPLTVDASRYLKVKENGFVQKLDDRFGSGREVDGKSNLIDPIIRALGYKGYDFDYMPRDGTAVLKSIAPGTVRSATTGDLLFSNGGPLGPVGNLLSYYSGQPQPSWLDHVRPGDI